LCPVHKRSVARLQPNRARRQSRRTRNLVEAIEAHASSGSEANTVVGTFNALTGQQKQDILNFLRPRVAKFWLPDAVVFLDAVPKTSVGKFDKKVLRERFKDWQNQGAFVVLRSSPYAQPPIAIVTKLGNKLSRFSHSSASEASQISSRVSIASPTGTS